MKSRAEIAKQKARVLQALAEGVEPRKVALNEGLSYQYVCQINRIQKARLAKSHSFSTDFLHGPTQ